MSIFVWYTYPESPKRVYPWELGDLWWRGFQTNHLRHHFKCPSSQLNIGTNFRGSHGTFWSGRIQQARHSGGTHSRPVAGESPVGHTVAGYKRKAVMEGVIKTSRGVCTSQTSQLRLTIRWCVLSIFQHLVKQFTSLFWWESMSFWFPRFLNFRFYKHQKTKTSGSRFSILQGLWHSSTVRLRLGSLLRGGSHKCRHLEIFQCQSEDEDPYIHPQLGNLQPWLQSYWYGSSFRLDTSWDFWGSKSFRDPH